MSKKKKNAVITFRIFKKHCTHESYGDCNTLLVEIGAFWPRNKQKCCEKNCPVFKRLKSADHGVYVAECVV